MAMKEFILNAFYFIEESSVSAQGIPWTGRNINNRRKVYSSTKIWRVLSRVRKGEIMINSP
jgi:hypothetical protein